MALKKLCICGKVIDYTNKYCDDCNIKVKEHKKESNRYYDKNIRNKESTDIYNSKEWEHLTKQCKAKYFGLDLYSLYMLGRLEYGTLCHHIEEVTLNSNRVYDLSNLIYLSTSNHNTIHNLYKKDYEGTKKMLFELIDRWEKEMCVF